MRAQPTRDHPAARVRAAPTRRSGPSAPSERRSRCWGWALWGTRPAPGRSVLEGGFHCGAAQPDGAASGVEGNVVVRHGMRVCGIGGPASTRRGSRPRALSEQREPQAQTEQASSDPAAALAAPTAGLGTCLKDRCDPGTIRGTNRRPVTRHSHHYEGTSCRYTLDVGRELRRTSPESLLPLRRRRGRGRPPRLRRMSRAHRVSRVRAGQPDRPRRLGQRQRSERRRILKKRRQKELAVQPG